MARRVLIVGDDLETNDVVTHCLEALGCMVETETDATALRMRHDRQAYDAIVLIFSIPEASWLAVLQQLRHGGSTIPAMALSESILEDKLMQEGAHAMLRNDCEGRDVKRAFQRILPPTREELIQDHSGGNLPLRFMLRPSRRPAILFVPGMP